VTTVVRAPITLLGARRPGLWAIGVAVIGSVTFLIGLPLLDTVQLIGLAAGRAALVTILTTVANADAGCRFRVSLPLADGART
jgi:hypothetical protein